MIKNYFKIAWRNILRNKLRTVIHILGLSMGISICFLIFNVVIHAYSFDNFHPDDDRIFRITSKSSYGNMEFSNPGVPFPLAEVIDQDLTGIEEKAHVYSYKRAMVRISETNKNLGRRNGALLVSNSFFKIFPREWIAGKMDQALEKPNSVVLSEETAKVYFPNLPMEEILGKEIVYHSQDTIAATVTGIVKPFSENSDLDFTDFISINSLDLLQDNSRFNMERWDAFTSDSQLFVKLAEGVGPEQLEASFPEMIKKYLGEEDGEYRQHFAQPLSELHFSDALGNEPANKLILNGLVILGLIILVLACLNFINLETAQAINRSKEVGIRKTLGGSKGQLTNQFLAETLVIVFIATCISGVFSELLRSVSKSYLPENFELNFISVSSSAFLIGFSLLLTLVAGLYPALVLGNYDPQRALKGERQGVTGKFSFGVFLRKNLTVVQFTCSIAFVIMVLVVNSQLRFLSRQEMGFDKEAVLFIPTPFMESSARIDVLKERLLQKSYIAGVSQSDALVSSNSYNTSGIYLVVDTTKIEIDIQTKNIDSSFVAVNTLELVAGENMNNQVDQVLVNEALVRELGLENPEEVLGLMFNYNGQNRVIKGVVKDFHALNLRSKISPLVMFYSPEYSPIINVKLEKGTDISVAKSEMDQLFKEVYPLESSEFNFLDEMLAGFYKDDQMLRNVMGFASGLAILISCLGLFGLSSFTIAQRTKEIGIRKVLGATIMQVLVMISKEYVWLIGGSFVLASGIAWFFSSEFLNTYAFKIGMPYGLFALSGLLILSICLLIVGLHAYNATQANPSEVLKDE
ncbi:ABC transporter permease [Algoriphagus lutimaris]|uniref:ABC transporter permease n=1 Tax=Algoriphagus lutimaris TaxID=613197 RepID=UPI00196AF3EB|nr:FtsX-like permease family protein [Algoriphagus lutimaris]MBN3518591.1 ABC transporter permease [Algoriphagus lutimaris]